MAYNSVVTHLIKVHLLPWYALCYVEGLLEICRAVLLNWENEESWVFIHVHWDEGTGRSHCEHEFTLFIALNLNK